MADQSARAALSAFPYTRRLTTRWADNDVYGHVNNVVYYAFFDTAVNGFLVERGVLDIQSSDAIGLVVETQCRFSAPIAFPDEITVGLRRCQDRQFERALRDRHFPQRRNPVVSRGTFRPCLCRPRLAAAGRYPRAAPRGADVDRGLKAASDQTQAGDIRSSLKNAGLVALTRSQAIGLIFASVVRDFSITPATNILPVVTVKTE